MCWVSAAQLEGKPWVRTKALVPGPQPQPAAEIVSASVLPPGGDPSETLQKEKVAETCPVSVMPSEPPGCAQVLLGVSGTPGLTLKWTPSVPPPGSAESHISKT